MSSSGAGVTWAPAGGSRESNGKVGFPHGGQRQPREPGGCLSQRRPYAGRVGARGRAEAGQLEACQLLRERGCAWGGALEEAARGGHRHVCEWLLASGCTLTCEAVYDAARAGHEVLMLWLLQLLGEDEDGANFVLKALLAAGAEGLGLEAFQRLHQQQLQAGQQQQQQQQEQQGGGGDGEQQQPQLVLQDNQLGLVLAAAAGSPTPDWQAKVEWLEGLGYRRGPTACSNAASRGPGGDAVGRLRWLHARGYQMHPGAASEATGKGDLAALRFLVEEAGVQPSEYQETAAQRGHLAVLQYLHGRGLQLIVNVVAIYAAEGGHLPVVAWAVETLGVKPGDVRHLLASAATSGSVELMAWLRERGWGWGDNSLNQAVLCGCEEALEWVVARGCPWPMDGQPFRIAARNGDPATLRCLHRLGCPWGPNQLLLVKFLFDWPPVPALRLLVELGCPVDWAAMTRAAEVLLPGEYRTALLEWLGEERWQRRRSSGA